MQRLDTKNTKFIVFKAIDKNLSTSLRTMNLFYRIFILILFVSPACFATHLAGGEIRASHVSGQTFKISVLLYLDAASGGQAASATNEVNVCMGDGNIITIPKISAAPITGSNEILLALFEKNYTFSSSGTFQLSLNLNNRSTALNFPNGSESPFFLWTVLNTQFSNATPILPNLVFNAGVKQVFSMDLKPVVTDSDSISIRLQKLSKPSPGTCGVRSLDYTYIYPNDVSKSGTFKINQQEKKLVWTAPEIVGSYIYALVIDEWRDGIRISETYREARINVTDKSGETVQVPPYQFAEEGGLITSVPNLESPEISIAVDAYPVPTEDYVTARAYSKRQSVIKLQLIDVNGRVLREANSENAVTVFQQKFDLRRFTPGVYIIRATNDAESTSQKIVR